MAIFNKCNAGRSSAAAQKSPRTMGSRSYGKSKVKAAHYIQSKDKLAGLIDKASIKATGKKGKLKDVWISLMSLVRLVRAYANGSYRQISAQALLTIVAALVYFVSPIDLIPDFILGLGLIDDAAVLAWTIKACAADLASFIAWENGRGERK